jgi:hypothetical protein
MRRILVDLIDNDTAKLAIILVVIGLIVVLTVGCATIEAVGNAPEEFWITTDLILAALVEDIWSIIKLFL